MLGVQNGIHTWMVDLSIAWFFILSVNSYTLKFSPPGKRPPWGPLSSVVTVGVGWARRRHSDFGGRSTRFGDCLFQSVGLQAVRDMASRQS